MSLLALWLIGGWLSKEALAKTMVKLLLTSNIQGKAIPKIQNQESEDPLLLLAQSILAEKEKGVDLYLDLGNGFYPGVISKYSSGSIMMDFFDYFGCAATLISSKDMQIGLQNLEFLQKSRDVHLLSANIGRSDSTVFSPYFLKEINGISIAFVGLSSSTRLEFDIAEEDLYGTELIDVKEALDAVLKEIEDLGIKHIVLLSGLRLINTLKVLEDYKQIEMALCGGDYTGRLFESRTSRIDLNDGRSIVMLDRKFDFYTLDLEVGDRISIQSLTSRNASPQSSFNERYLSFVNRLTLWKENYLTEQHQRIIQIDREYLLDDQRFLQLMRDHFDCEIAIADQDTINPYPIKSDISQSDLLGLVNLDFKIFTFFLSGGQVSKVVGGLEESELVIAGIIKKDKIHIQGYPIDSARRYKVAATQSVLRKIRRLFGRDFEYHNSWKTVTELITQDLKNKKVILRDDFSYLDDRYRSFIDVYLSNFITSGNVDRSREIETPSDQPGKSYTKWGLEDIVDLTLYNKSHRFVLSPYVQYARQDDQYINNLLRGTFLYEYNLSEKLRPYNKFQCDTVVDETEAGLRPVLIRETIGGSLYGDYLTGKIGLGLEKKVKDPVEEALYGVETILGFNYPFWKYLTYKLTIDSFVSSQNSLDGKWGLRSEINNILSINFNAFLSLSLRHKYFYLFEPGTGDNDIDQDYRSSQLFTTLDLKSDWKFW